MVSLKVLLDFPHLLRRHREAFALLYRAFQCSGFSMASNRFDSISLFSMSSLYFPSHSQLHAMGRPTDLESLRQNRVSSLLLMCSYISCFSIDYSNMSYSNKKDSNTSFYSKKKSCTSSPSSYNHSYITPANRVSCSPTNMPSHPDDHRGIPFLGKPRRTPQNSPLLRAQQS